MATNLTPEMLQKILGLGNLPYSPTMNANGMNYQAAYRNNAQGEAGQGQEGGLDQIIGYDPGKTAVGQAYDMYDPAGKFTGQGKFKKVKDGDLLATGLISALGMMYGLPTMPGSEAAAAAAPAGELGASLASIEGAGGLAPTLGAEAAGGLGTFAAPGLDVAAGLAGTAPEFAGMSGFAGGLGAAGGFGGATLLPALAAGAPAASSGLLGMLGKGAGAAASALGEKSSLLGLGATALGGALGAKGQESEGSRTNKLDPRMDAMLYGQDGSTGLLGQAMQLAQQQMANGGLNDRQRRGLAMQEQWLTSPEYAQGFNQMKNVGMGLLSRGIAANPYAK